MSQIIKYESESKFQFAAIDWGYSYVKAIMNGEKFIFPSAVGNGWDISFDNTHTDPIEKIDIVVDGMRYFVGQHALNQSTEFYHSIGKNRTGRITDILIKSTLGTIFEEDGDCRIVTGLPPSFYNTAADFIQFVKGEHYFTMNGRLRYINVTHVLVIPQLMGTYIDYAYDAFGQLKQGIMTKGKIALIDPGFGTGDFGLIDGGRYADGFTETTRNNMYDVCKKIKNRLEREYGYKENELLKIDRILRTKSATIHAQRKDVSSIVNQARMGTAMALVKTANNLWESITPDIYILTGGGAEALYEYMFLDLPNLTKPEDAQFANVRGYYKRAVREWAHQLV